MRVWITLLAGVVGLVTGSLLTLWATGNEDPPRPSERRVVVPQPCLDAIDAARDRLLLNADAPELARSYATVWERVVDAARDLHVGAVSEITADVRRLNRRARTFAPSAANARFSGPAQECEELGRSTAVPASVVT